MSEETKQGGEPDAADFDLKTELSILVANEVIPQVIAEKLEQKLVEKQVDITKDQLHTLAEKIHNLLEKYKKNGSLPDPNKKMTDPKEASIEYDNHDRSSKEKTLDDAGIEIFLNKLKELQQKIKSLEQVNKKQLDSFAENDEQMIQDANEISLPYDESISTAHNVADPLQFIPTDPESIIVLMNWIQYLVNRCGHEHLENVLDYYVDVDWITDDVKISLLEYATGITEGIDLVSEYSPEKKEEKTANLPSKNHIQSYLYIQRLKGKKIEKHFVERINGELARIEKKVDTYYHTQ
ncbi:MAG: FlaD/FlaE family flagellar protein [Candidatus Thermoplasmatota archaeon]|nr:FlaD/FlaE family flagellar protein [Candidatus Thermoplasmatota archaeon]